MSVALVNGKNDFTPHREIAHIRQDLAVTKEILAIVKDENDRLRGIAEERGLEISRLGEELKEVRIVLMDERHSFETEISRLRSSRVSLEEEFADALAERKRLSDLLHTMRGQVDGRLTKLVEELQRKDEEIHRLEYKNRESEREIERINREAKLGSALESELEKVRGDYTKAAGEIAFLQEQIGQYQVELSFLREKAQQPYGGGIDSSQMFDLREVISLLPLYRQWFFESDVSAKEIEDLLDLSLSDGSDSLAYMTSSGAPYKPPIIERQRLAELKKIERTCKKGVSTFCREVRESYEESVALSVHGIRDNFDSLRHSIEKLKILSRQLSETLKAILQLSKDLHGQSLSTRQTECEMKAKVNIFEHEKNDFVDTLTQKFQLEMKSYEKERQKLEAEITSLKATTSILEGEKNSLSAELLKVKQEGVAASLGNAAKLAELEHKLHETLRASQEISKNALEKVSLDHERERRDAIEENARLRNVLEADRAKVESMKRLLSESKRRRCALKEENTSIRRQLLETENLLNSLRVELLGAKQTIELLHAELQFAENREEGIPPSSSSRMFRMFKREAGQGCINAKTVFLPRPP